MAKLLLTVDTVSYAIIHLEKFAILCRSSYTRFTFSVASTQHKGLLDYNLQEDKYRTAYLYVIKQENCSVYSWADYQFHTIFFQKVNALFAETNLF